MLENWVWDYETLKRFAVDAEGRPIPEALVQRMNRARGFAEAFNDGRQLGHSAASLAYHLRRRARPTSPTSTAPPTNAIR